MPPARVLLALTLAAAASAAAAQTTAPVKRRPVIPAPAPAPPPPPPRNALAPAPVGRLALEGLRSPGDGGGACRVTCARVRYTCESGADDTCGPQWSSCLKSCSDSGSPPAPALLPRR